ncbi:MAG: hypothetical protein JWO77_3124 [Ilumatobacteraceae bacterium]|nr:hypothetical protein [Ilumatobacteraceae bacterium]
MKIWSHLVVVLSVLLVGFLALNGFIGENAHKEKIEQLQVVVSASGDSGVRITETIDQDFGTESRHGPQLVVPEDFGAPTDITASSETAPDDVHTDDAPFDSRVQGTRIRVGDPDVTVSGQHRYTISYVLPTARFAAPTFALDAVGAESEFPIEDVTVVFDGISLENPTCVVGGTGSEEPCEFERGAPLRLAYPRLDPFEGITVGGEVTEWTAAASDGIAAPPLPERRSTDRGVTALWTMALGAIAAAWVYLWSVRRGSNEVIGAGAAEAAHGVSGTAPGTTRKVTDAELAEMTTIEFAPPKGIEPWQGAVVYSEVLDQSSVTAWFSGAIAADHLAIEKHGDEPRLTRGPKAGEADPVTAGVLDKLFGNREAVDLDGYDSQFASAWSKVETLQDEWVANCGWWNVGTPKRGRSRPGGCASLFTLAFLAVVFVVGAAFLLGFLGVLGGIVTGILVGIGLPYLVARVAYAPLRPGRSANGSAYALQVASFRKFLVESEGQYVQWAWENGLLRQYSAWAVALDAADAWQAAMERAGVPQAEIEHSSPLMVHAMGGAFVSSHVQPTQSGSGGSSGFSGGGFSGGSVGGGGGGGSHGSW